MKVIIPMAGMGTRMRPHTLITPKPLLKIAGCSIIERIIKDLASKTGRQLDEVHYVIGSFGTSVENQLKNIAESIGCKSFIHYQNEALGTAHAIYCAKDALHGEVIISFADTLFDGNLTIQNQEAIIWTKEVENPEQYGVVVIDANNNILRFTEKPKTLVSKNAIIGIYYFRKGEVLKNDIEFLIKNDKKKNGEFQLTDSLENLVSNNVKFICKTVNAWLDCGNKTEFLRSNHYFLQRDRSTILSEIDRSQIIEPVFIGSNVKITNSKIGPDVSIEDNCIINSSTIKDSIIRNNSGIINSVIENSMIGAVSKINGFKGVGNIGDYAEYSFN